MTNIVNLIKATNGKNLVISSSASDFAYHRTPYDVASMMICLGLNKNLALACMKENCAKVIEGGQHRRFFKGTVQEVEVEKVEKMSKRIKKHHERIRNLKKKKLS